jgi:hypothetical protein
VTCRSCAKARRILRELIEATDAYQRASDASYDHLVNFERGKSGPPSVNEVQRLNARRGKALAKARTYLSEVAL